MVASLKRCKRKNNQEKRNVEPAGGVAGIVVVEVVDVSNPAHQVPCD
jgi:hypothetical protein